MPLPEVFNVRCQLPKGELFEILGREKIPIYRHILLFNPQLSKRSFDLFI